MRRKGGKKRGVLGGGIPVMGKERVPVTWGGRGDPGDMEEGGGGGRRGVPVMGSEGGSQRGGRGEEEGGYQWGGNPSDGKVEALSQ